MIFFRGSHSSRYKIIIDISNSFFLYIIYESGLGIIRIIDSFI